MLDHPGGSRALSSKKRRSVYAKTRAEVAEKLAAAIADRDRGLTFDAGTLSVAEHLDRYLDEARGRLRPKPFNRAEGLVRNHLRPTLGSVKLKDLAPAHLRGLLRGQAEVRAIGQDGRLHPRHPVRCAQAGRSGRPDPTQPRRGRQAPEGGQKRDDLPLPHPGKDAA